MIYVLDASLIVAALVEEDHSGEARAVVTSAREAAVFPPHFPLEVVNALTVKHRRKLLTKLQRDKAFETFIDLNILPDDEADRTGAMARTIVLADDHGLTIYDAAYLELAMRRRAVLGSLDGDLRKAAKAEGLVVAP